MRPRRRLAMKKGSIKVSGFVVGLDLGDKYSQICVLDAESGEIVEETRLRTTKEALRERFGKKPKMRIALEAGTHSPWVSRLLKELGHEVLVANPRKLRLVYQNKRKDDRVDATYLARLARMEPKLLAPLQHRSKSAQADLALLRSRDKLVQVRTSLIHHLRCVVKSLGERMPRSSTEGFNTRLADGIPEPLRPALKPILKTIEDLTAKIRKYDKLIEQMAKRAYPETARMTQVRGVGALTGLAYLLTLEDPRRFERSRTVGAYVGMVPGRDSSGESDPQRHITKEGDAFLRRLLVQCANYILGPFGTDCDLRRYGERIAERGGKNGKKRARVAVGRKLAVLLHHLWITGDEYKPLYLADKETRRAAGAGA
jgi:transposase